MTPTSRSDLANNSSGMRIFKGRYYNINRKLLMCFRLWPYEAKPKKYILRTIVIGLLTLASLTQLISVKMHFENIDRLMLGILCFFVISLMNSNAVAMILAEENMTALHRRIAHNWQIIEDYCERQILHKYSEGARKGTIFFVALVVVPSAVIAAMLPIIPKILDLIQPLENPRPNMYISSAEFFIDRETHFHLFFVLEYIGRMLIALVMIAVDTMYFVSVEHCCALYAIIRSRLLELRQKMRNSSSTTADVDSYEWLCGIIQLHQRALNFTSVLNDTYSILFLFTMVSALIIIPLDACAIIAHLDKPLHLVPYAVFLVNAMTFGFFLAYPGQRIIDHQLSLLEAAYCNEWYVVPLRTKKLLLTFMLRCTEPVMITAAGLLPINLEVYFKIMKTSASYITVASSFR